MLSFGLIGLGGGAGCDSRLPPAPANRDANGNWRRLLSAAAIGALQAPDGHGMRLPPGFASRVIARSGEAVASTGYVWHGAPDGGATFAAEGAGWIYVSNAELVAPGGGVSAVVFDATGKIVGAHAICGGTSRNCAGGPTPWGTWLTCEEIERGRVIECDPSGARRPQSLDALGWFAHEAAAVDANTGHVILTEDQRDGRLYRFRPATRGDLRAGVLEVAKLSGKNPFGVTWLPVPDPNPSPNGTRTRHQVGASTPFDGGEGAWWHDGVAYFTTKGDNRVWALDTAGDRLHLLYDARSSGAASLTGVDNVVVSKAGRLCVAEDGGDMEVCVVDATGASAPLLQLVGHDQSELTGIAFSPDGARLYVSSQRGTTGQSSGGVTFEVTGPFAA
jgi:secreted PhoX family phosphatase